MKFVFFGTPEYVLPILDALNKKFKIKGKSPIEAVVTQEPKPTGRKQLLSYSPVDNWAYKRDLPIFFDPEDIIKNSITADMGILASYGKIIPKSVINYFKFGIINVHPSCLPKYRGASPIQASIISQDNETGVSIIKLDEKLDHGPIVCQFKEEILPQDTFESLRNRLFERSCDVLTALILPYTQGKITLKKQDDTKASFTRQIIKEDAFIPPKYLEKALKKETVKDKWTIPFIKDFAITPTGAVLDRFIRAMYPWPIAWTIISIDSSNHAKRIKILKSHIDNEKLILDEVQMEGKSPVTWRQFKEGYPQSFLKY
ncbi:MAG TPA: methionyl-tRNA formyltransferase [Patescibacteria group bacterium]|nr:methionyl-tRNA formyltransferase [Patescibacteria group bacterium]